MVKICETQSSLSLISSTSVTALQRCSITENTLTEPVLQLYSIVVLQERFSYRKQVGSGKWQVASGKWEAGNGK